MKLPNLATRTSRTLALLCSAGMHSTSLPAQRVAPPNAPTIEMQSVIQELERMRAGLTNATRTRPALANPGVSLVGIVIDESGPTAIFCLQPPASQWPNRLERKCYSLRESETVGQLSELQVDPPNRSVSVKFNGVATNLMLVADSTPALPRTVASGQFQCALRDAPMEVCVRLYGGLTGRATLSTHGVSTNRVTASLTKPLTSAKAAEWLRESALHTGVAIIPGGDYFAIVVPAAQTNLAERIITAPPATGAAKELTYAYSDADGDIVLDEYADLLGKKIEATRDVLIAGSRIRSSFVTHRPLTKDEARSVFETLFRIHSLRIESVDDTHARMTLARDP
jgi:hypothetical protein